MKWRAKAGLCTSSLKQPNGTQWCHFYLHMSHKAAKKSIAKLINQLCGESQLAVACQGKMGTFKGHPDSCGHQTG